MYPIWGNKYITPEKFSGSHPESSMGISNLESSVVIDIPDIPSPNITKKFCPKYGLNIKGFMCLGWNSIKITKTDSWQQCAALCTDYVAFFFVKCKQWSYDVEKKKCLIKTGDKLCKYPDENYISGIKNTSEVGLCSTTCKVGDWSAWTPCSSYCAGITQRVRHVIKSPTYKSEICPRLVETAMCKGSIDCPSNCPNYHVVGLGWGCKVEMNRGGGTMRKYVNTWHECLGLCKSTENCTYWSFQGISGVETCFLVIGEVGCTYHALGWVSGDTNVVAVDCPVKCFVGEWSSWTACPSEDVCTPNSMSKRSRPLISTPPDMNQKLCPPLTESNICDCAVRASRNTNPDFDRDLRSVEEVVNESPSLKVPRRFSNQVPERKLFSKMGQYSTNFLLKSLYLDFRENYQIQNDTLGTSSSNNGNYNQEYDPEVLNRRGMKNTYDLYNALSSYLLGVNYTNFGNSTLEKEFFN
ncbi:TSP1 domain-containing protein TSP5 precursor [Cryptosporidium felis]|nr:TSP1 domain-containing protein TSP5 precursor [Cryptosporidium felis]